MTLRGEGHDLNMLISMYYMGWLLLTGYMIWNSCSNKVIVINSLLKMTHKAKACVWHSDMIDEYSRDERVRQLYCAMTDISWTNVKDVCIIFLLFT